MKRINMGDCPSTWAQIYVSARGFNCAREVYLQFNSQIAYNEVKRFNVI